MNQKRLEKRSKQYVLITGASRGIGYAFVLAFLNKGYSIIACSRQADHVRDLQDGYPRQKIITFNYDLSIPDNCYKLFADTQKYESFIVINNAGMLVNSRFGADPAFDSEFALDTQAVYLLNKLFYNRMYEKNQGIIINVASIVAFFSLNNLVGYQAAKSYVLNLSRSLSLEAKVERKKIKVFAVCPGLTATALIENTTLNQRVAMSPQRCVRIALRKILFLRYRKAVIITGFTNIFLARFLIHLLPRWVKILIFRKKLLKNDQTTDL